MLGTIFNAVTIILGGGLGLLFKRGIPERFSDILLKGMSLCVGYIGISGMLKGKSGLVLVLSITIGAIIGEALNLDGKMKCLGDWVQSRFKNNNSPVSEGFVTATLLFGVGAMAIVGSLQSGLTGDNSTLFTKSILDGITAIIFTSQMGFGVIFSAIPIFFYQGTITALAGILAPVLTKVAIAEMTCVGSLLIFALALNMLGLTKIKVINYIPAIIIAAVLAQFPMFY
ncbi:MAG: DUF554 domain-containing protein [Bacillota bacterium]|nr:DUF554 domain-containing protein [Bacillota bacterium]